MPSDADFLAFIQEDPSDSHPQLIYADWLDDQGDPRGELVRLLVEVKENVLEHYHWTHFLQAVKAGFKTTDFFKLLELLNEQQQRLFACQCAESVLHHFETKHPRHQTPRKAIEIARKVAKGETVDHELDALSHSVWNVARACRATKDAWEAARAVQATTNPIPQIAARDAAGAASRAAYYHASIDQCLARQLVWTVERLLEFRVN